jgi:fluoroacetyl-CoA thioesterase
MQASIFPGLTFTQTLDVEDRPRAGHPGATATVPTSMAVAFVEWACGEALQPYLDDGERSVGTRIAFEHEAIAPVGPISAHVELIGIEGRRLRFKVIAEDSERIIGRGLHERMVVDADVSLRRRKRTSGAADHYSAACM